MVNHSYSRNRTLYGLRTNSEIRILYNVETKEVQKIIGLDSDDIEISATEAFNIPQYISVAGIPYYPAKYGFSNGDVWYHARKPPAYQIHTRNVGILGERAKVMNVRLTPEMLNEYDKPSHIRPRQPGQLSIMGESAKLHAQRLIDQGILIIPDDSAVQWHWCHLVAFSMLPTKRAQNKRNLFVGSAACNGQMANIEAAVKLFVYETGRPISLEVTATIIADTHLGKSIRYQAYERKSETLFTDYFDALTEIKSDYVDYENVYEKLMSQYSESLKKRSK